MIYRFKVHVFLSRFKSFWRENFDPSNNLSCTTVVSIIVLQDDTAAHNIYNILA